MSALVTTYVVGAALFAFIYGFRTPYSAEPDGPRAVLTVLGWPIIVIVGAGQASRMFSVEKHAQDLADGMEP